MLEFPQTTEYGRKIPKQKFYDKANIPAPVRRMFVAEIESVIWRNKFSSATLRVEAGEYVNEIELLQIILKRKELSRQILETIAAAIPYHLIFLPEYEGEFQLRLAYSPARGKYFWYETPWQAWERLKLKIDGLNLDSVYENFARQIGGAKLAGGDSLRKAAERERAREALRRKIASLAGKLRAEKQFNRQVEINRELRAARAELAALEV